MDENVPLGRQGACEILNTIEKSGLLIVIVGKSHVSGMLQYQITTVVSRTKIAILLVNGTTVPHELRGHRTMVFPPELLEIKSEPGAEYTEAQACAVTKLIEFLIRR
ncbi:hypothetical protein BaRGS_00034074 [Batillaria attramentaria]|uniref:Uncharacterized protein n=1 Tax=Batillaria attramentaria TaxID=370345 RepID=A0ABD0JIF2_9CAEN